MQEEGDKVDPRAINITNRTRYEESGVNFHAMRVKTTHSLLAHCSPPGLGVRPENEKGRPKACLKPDTTTKPLAQGLRYLMTASVRERTWSLS